MEVASDLEVDKEGAAELLKKGSKVYVFESNYTDPQFLQHTFKLSESHVEVIDMNDAYPILMDYDGNGDVKTMAKKFDKGIIVCPHGNTSKKFAMALAKQGIKAYSLKGGIAKLKGEE